MKQQGDQRNRTGSMRGTPIPPLTPPPIPPRNIPNTSSVPTPVIDDDELNLTQSTRFKLSIFSTIVLTITGIVAYIYNPENIDKFAFYTINMVLPIISYVIGRTIRSGRHNEGLIKQTGTRYRTALITFLGSLVIGVVCYIFSPQNIDKLGMYMIGVVLPIVGIIIGQSFRKSERRMYDHDYDGYGDYYGNNNNNNNGGYNGGYNGDDDHHNHHGTQSCDNSDYGDLYNKGSVSSGNGDDGDVNGDDGDKNTDDYN